MSLNRAEIENKIRSMMIERLNLSIAPNELTTDAALFGPESKLDLDSIDALEITLGMEEAFQFHIDEREIGKNQFRNLGTLVAFVEQKLAAKSE